MLKIIFLDIVYVMTSVNVIGKKIKVDNGLKVNLVIHFGPIGPYLVTKDEINDLNNFKSFVKCFPRHQTGNTNQMIFNFNFLVSHISSFITLMPGDIITTGTPPGVGLGMMPTCISKER